MPRPNNHSYSLVFDSPEDFRITAGNSVRALPTNGLSCARSLVRRMAASGRGFPMVITVLERYHAVVTSTSEPVSDIPACSCDSPDAAIDGPVE